MHCGGRGGNRIFYKVQPFSLQYARPAPKLIHKLSTKSGKPASAALCAAFCGNVCGSPLQSSDSELFVFGACGLEDGPDSDAVAQDKHFGVELITHGAAQHLQEGAFRSGIGTGHASHGDLSDMQVSVGLGVAGGAIAIAAAASVQLSAVFEMKAEAAVTKSAAARKIRFFIIFQFYQGLSCHKNRHLKKRNIISRTVSQKKFGQYEKENRHRARSQEISVKKSFFDSKQFLILQTVSGNPANHP